MRGRATAALIALIAVVALRVARSSRADVRSRAPRFIALRVEPGEVARRDVEQAAHDLRVGLPSALGAMRRRQRTSDGCVRPAFAGVVAGRSLEQTRTRQPRLHPGRAPFHRGTRSDRHRELRHTTELPALPAVGAARALGEGEPGSRAHLARAGPTVPSQGTRRLPPGRDRWRSAVRRLDPRGLGVDPPRDERRPRPPLVHGRDRVDDIPIVHRRRVPRASRRRGERCRRRRRVVRDRQGCPAGGHVEHGRRRPRDGDTGRHLRPPARTTASTTLRSAARRRRAIRASRSPTPRRRGSTFRFRTDPRCRRRRRSSRGRRSSVGPATSTGTDRRWRRSARRRSRSRLPGAAATPTHSHAARSLAAPGSTCCLE